jgi:iron complex outermembrane receptor protein
LNSTDGFSGTGGLAFRPSITNGNPLLDPEEADVWNIGLSWIPEGALEGFNLNVDYYSFDYTNLISRQGHQALIDQDNALRCPTGLNAVLADGPLCGVSDQDGNGINEVYSIGAGIPNSVIRAEDGSLLRTNASYFNAPSLETSGIDLQLGYEFSIGDAGLFTTNFGISYTLDYDIVSDAGVSIDGLGSRNNGNSIGHPLPEYKANLTLGWSRKRHGASIIVRHIDGYTDDTPQSALRGAYIGLAPEIDSFTTVDVQYNVDLPALSFQEQESVLTLGIKNLANETPPRVNTDGGFDPFTHDPRGRIYYGRFTFSL